MISKGFKRKIAAGIAIAAACATGITSVALRYRDKDFNPDTYDNSRNRNDNQIVFPGDDAFLGDEYSDDSELWEQDKNSNENLKPEDRPDASLLFQTLKVADVSEQGDTANEDNQDKQSEDNNSQNINNDNNDIIYAPDNSEENKTPDIVVPNDKTNTGNVSGDNNGSTDTGNGGNGNTGSDDNGGGSNDSNGDNSPDTPVKPSEPTTPVNPPEPSGPSEPEKSDADTTVPSLPDDFTDTDPYPGDDNIDIDDKDDYERYSLEVVGLFNMEDEKNSLYLGEYLNEQRILCSVYVYLCVDGRLKYRLTELNDNFKIGDYPKQITEDEITFDFYYRPGEEYDWIKESYTTEIKYSGKLLLQDWESGEYIKQYMVPIDKPDVYLFKYYGQMNTDSDKLFLGWSKEENGTSEGVCYRADETGAQILYPLPLVDIDDQYSMESEGYYLTIDGSFSYDYLQTLKEYRGDSSELVIPDGIEALDLTGDFDWNTWDIIYKDYDKIYIPASVITLAGPYDDNPAEGYTFNVLDEYSVSDDNITYSSYEGMLLNKKQTIIYDIPDNMEKINVPDTVTDINFNVNNSISQITFKGKNPAQADFSALHNTNIYVPSAHYLKYLAAWGKNPGGNGNTLISDDTVESYIEDDKAIYSSDGKILIAAKSSVDGTFVVPEGVEAISENAFEHCGEVDLLILPSTLKTLEDNSLSDSCTGKIVFLGKKAPSVAQNTFADGSSINILTEARSSYEESFKNISSDITLNICYKNFEYIKEGIGGFEYLYEEACDEEPCGAILIKAPEDIEYFNEKSAPGLEWKEIAADAFSGCTKLYLVELPASVKTVGRRAFSGCASLQGIVTYSEDNIQIEEGAVDSTDKLRFIAFNTENIEFYNYSGFVPIYVPCDAVIYGYYGRYNTFSPSYYLVEMGDGKLLYGVGTDDDNNPASNCYLLGATDNISGDITLANNATEIAAYVFRNCQNEFNIKGMNHIIAIGDSAFENSGLSGDITIGGNMIVIGGSAFKNCKGITKLAFDGSGLSKLVYLNPLGTEVFYGCSNLTEVSITGTGYYDLSDSMFYKCTSLSNVNIAETAGINIVSPGAFAETAIEELVLPPSVKSVGFGVFNSCKNLRKVTFTSEEAPDLYGYESGIEFYFSNMDYDDGWISVPSGCEQAYIDSWKYYMLGWTPDNEDMVTDEELHQSENRVRAMLGLELLPDDDTDTSDTTAVPDLQCAPDSDDCAAVSDAGDETDKESDNVSDNESDDCETEDIDICEGENNQDDQKEEE